MSRALSRCQPQRRWPTVSATPSSKRFAVGDCGAEDAAVQGLDDRCQAVALPGRRRHDLTSLAGESPDLFNPAHNIDMRQSAPGVFAAFDRIDTAAIEADQHDRRACRDTAPTQGYPGLAVIERKRHGHG